MLEARYVGRYGRRCGAGHGSAHLMAYAQYESWVKTVLESLEVLANRSDFRPRESESTKQMWSVGFTGQGPSGDDVARN